MQAMAVELDSPRPAAPGSALGVADPGADHAFLATIFVAFARRVVERGRDLRPDRIAVWTAGIGQVDGERRTGLLHRHGGAFALALLERRGLGEMLGRIVE